MGDEIIEIVPSEDAPFNCYWDDPHYPTYQTLAAEFTREGAKAYFMGLENCPYTKTSLSAIWWREGYEGVKKIDEESTPKDK